MNCLLYSHRATEWDSFTKLSASQQRAQKFEAIARIAGLSDRTYWSAIKDGHADPMLAETSLLRLALARLTTRSNPIRPRLP